MATISFYSVFPWEPSSTINVYPQGEVLNVFISEKRIKGAASLIDINCFFGLSTIKTKVPNELFFATEIMQRKNTAYKRTERVPSSLWASDVCELNLGNNLSGSELIRANIITAELDEIPHGATLDELMSIIGPLTRDRGAVMRAIAAEELDEFGELAATAWRAREHGTESALTEHQEHLHRQYNRWSARMEARAEKCRQLLLETLPDFNIQRYSQDPGYLRKLVMERDGEQFNVRVKTWKQNNRDHLAYLRMNIEKLESENEEFHKQLTQVREKHKRVQQRQATREQQLIDENDRIEKSCKLIKHRIGKNAKLIDSLLLELEKGVNAGGSGGGGPTRSVVRRLDFHDEDLNTTDTEDDPDAHKLPIQD